MSDAKNTPGAGTRDPADKLLTTLKTWFEKALPDQASRLQAVALWNRITAYTRANQQEFQSFDVLTRAGDLREIALRLMNLTSGRVLAAFEDVTERKQADRFLRESEETFRALAEHSLDAIMRFDRQCRHLYVNPIAEIQCGIPVKEFIGKTHRELGFPPELICRLEEAIDKVFSAKKPHRIEFQLPNKIWIDWLLIPEFDEQGEVKAVMTSGRDLTEHKKADEERIKLETRLQQSQKMEAIGRLAGGLAHDFNNILTGILGYAEMIKMSFAPSDLVYSEADEIRQACRRAADLINQLLAFSRNQVIKPRVVNPNDLILDSRNMLQRLIGEDIGFHFQSENDLWNIKMDPGQFDQVLVNLVINARDAMPQGGRLTITTSNLSLKESRVIGTDSIAAGDFVVITIGDSGSGMSDEVKLHIFEPFFSSQQFGQGAGLGLPTVYGIVRQNRGFIDFHSELGKGSTFQVCFPRAHAKAEEPSEPPAPVFSSGRESILLVEDEKMVRKTVSEILEKQGYTLFTAQDGLEALRISNQCRTEIHLLLSDVVMPNMNGQELYRRLKNDRLNLKALFMSGYTENLITKQGILDRGTHFIQKPFSIESLCRKVRQVLDQ